MTPIRAEMAASVLSVGVVEGDPVEPGAEVVLLESMKMEIPVRSAHRGVVARVAVSAGQLVSEGDVLVELSVDE